MENKHKYISRYEKEKGGGYTFCGWRLCITRNKERYVRYYSDKTFGTPESSCKAALAERDALLAELNSGKVTDVAAFFRTRRQATY
ncbi:MAG: hypothetical protein IJB31_04320 [Akkermansia sp.]|nr:hypothetical protein [Akkermansia sp.]